MLERIAVAHVPIFCPMMIGTAMPKVIFPDSESACSIPTEAAELWIMAVTTRPINMPNTGLRNTVKALAKEGESASGATDPLIKSIPYIKTAKPKSAFPTSRFFCVLAVISNRIPINASTGEKDSGFSIRINGLSPEIPIMLMTHAVMVVPMLDPMITPAVLAMFIRPELTRPTSITVTAEELCTAIVMTQPISRPAKRFFVIRLTIFSMRAPAMRSRLFDI